MAGAGNFFGKDNGGKNEQKRDGEEETITLNLVT